MSDVLGQNEPHSVIGSVELKNEYSYYDIIIYQVD